MPPSLGALEVPVERLGSLDKNREAAKDDASDFNARHVVYEEIEAAISLEGYVEGDERGSGQLNECEGLKTRLAQLRAL